MKNGKCPKCGSNKVFTKQDGITSGDGGLGVCTSFWTTASTSKDYICTNCGYFERYIDDKEKLEVVSQKWENVGKH
jgi:predicted nucleic-acid-binding Zn-ribbon protein